MLKDITLGQYFPGTSPIHLLDPRTKLIMLVLYIIALFCAARWVSYGVVFAFLAITVAVSSIPVKSLVRGMKPLILILVFTGVLNLFFTAGEGDPLVDFWVITIYAEGVVRAILMVARILMLISGTGEVIEPDDGVLAIGSGGNYALAAARALIANTDLPAPEIARKALEIASEICVYTNGNIIVETV